MIKLNVGDSVQVKQTVESYYSNYSNGCATGDAMRKQEIPGATGSRADVLRRYPKAKLVRVGDGIKFPIYEIRAGRTTLGRAEGSTAAWDAACKATHNNCN